MTFSPTSPTTSSTPQWEGRRVRTGYCRSRRRGLRMPIVGRRRRRMSWTMSFHMSCCRRMSWTILTVTLSSWNDVVTACRERCRRRGLSWDDIVGRSHAFQCVFTTFLYREKTHVGQRSHDGNLSVQMGKNTAVSCHWTSKSHFGMC